MTDSKKDILISETEHNEWPSRDGRVSELEEALHNYLDWGRIAILRSKFEYPSQILDKSKEDLSGEISRPAEDVETIQNLIRIWDEDPDNFVNPFKEKMESGRIMIRVEPQTKAKEDVAVKED